MNIWYGKVGATATAIKATLSDSSKAVVSLVGTSVRFRMWLKGLDNRTANWKVDAPATIADSTNGVVEYDWLTADVDTAGTYQCHWQVTYSNGKIDYFPTPGYDQVQIDQ